MKLAQDNVDIKNKIPEFPERMKLMTIVIEL